MFFVNCRFPVTGKHIGSLLGVAALTCLFVVFSGSDKSLGAASSISVTTGVLISFILAGYVTIPIARWDRVRNSTLGKCYASVRQPLG
jgi:K+ transporter